MATLICVLPEELYPSLDFGASSIPQANYCNDFTLHIPTQWFHGKVATRNYNPCSVYFEETVGVKKVKKCAKNKLASRHAHLRHKNIVCIIANTTCIPVNLVNGDNIGTRVMEYAREGNLHQVIYGCAGMLAVDRLARLANKLFFAVRYGIVHLDIKPANVLVSREDLCKIVDFGCSLKLELGGEGLSSLTPQMSHGRDTYTHRVPEGLNGEDMSPKSDILSHPDQERPYRGDRQHTSTFQGDPVETLCSSAQCLWKHCAQVLGEPRWRPSTQDVLTDLDKIWSEPYFFCLYQPRLIFICHYQARLYIIV
uniref:non-specific serine/threonine protein kinase n=1 Tax=Salmo trutta TaxID=8032 RepID=A0A674A0G1_SALTR